MRTAVVRGHLRDSLCATVTEFVQPKGTRGSAARAADRTPPMSQARRSNPTTRVHLRRGSDLLVPIQGVRLSDEVYERLLGKPDVEFPLAIAAATHNTVMAHIVNSLHGMVLAVLRVRFVVRKPARTQLLVTQHETILEAIQCRDRVGATKAMVVHLEFIEDEIKRFSGKICRSSISASSLRLRDSVL